MGQQLAMWPRWSPHLFVPHKISSPLWDVYVIALWKFHRTKDNFKDPTEQFFRSYVYFLNISSLITSASQHVQEPGFLADIPFSSLALTNNSSVLLFIQTLHS